MPLLHDAAFRTQLIARVQSLTPDTPARWGKMTVDQMLWHVSSALEMALGRTQLQSGKPPLPLPIMRFVVLTLPWPKNLPTNPELVAKQRHDFGAEKQRCLQLVDEFARKDIRGGSWADHPLLGAMPGKKVSHLQAKHLNHHLRQFGA